MGRVILGRGAAAIELSGTLAEQIEATVRRLAPTVYDRIDEEIEALRESAQARWPLGDDKADPEARNKTQPYHSKNAFEHGVRIVTDGVEGFITNYAVNIRGRPYWFFIKIKDKSEDKRKRRAAKVNAKIAARLQGDKEPGSPIQMYVRKPLKERTKVIAAELAEEIRQLVREG